MSARHEFKKMTEVDLETLLVLNSALKSVYTALSMSLDELVDACRFKLEFVIPLEGTDLVLVKTRDRVPGYIYVSDLSQFVYCPRRFYLSYRVANIVDKIRLRKIREKLLKLKPELREGAVLYERETLRRILVGTFVHRAVENAFRMLNLKATYKPELEVVDEELGLIGHVDLVKLRYPSEIEIEKCLDETGDDELCSRPRAVVYEIKSGLYREVPESYKKQVQLYAWLLEKVHKYVIEHVYIVHPVNPAHSLAPGVNIRLVKVEYSTDIARELLDLVKQARRILLSREPPRVSISRDKCERCAFKLICLY